MSAWFAHLTLATIMCRRYVMMWFVGTSCREVKSVKCLIDKLGYP
jgi:hypothetical protein